MEVDEIAQNQLDALEVSEIEQLMPIEAIWRIFNYEVTGRR
jgi:hypothetical protein